MLYYYFQSYQAYYPYRNERLRMRKKRGFEIKIKKNKCIGYLKKEVNEYSKVNINIYFFIYY